MGTILLTEYPLAFELNVAPTESTQINLQCPKYGCLPHQFDPVPHLVVLVGLGDWKWYQSASRPSIPIWLLYTLLVYLAPFCHNTQCGRWQSDAAIRIGGVPDKVVGKVISYFKICQRCSLVVWRGGWSSGSLPDSGPGDLGSNPVTHFDHYIIFVST